MGPTPYAAQSEYWQAALKASRVKRCAKNSHSSSLALRYLARSRSHPESVPSDIHWILGLLFATFFALLLIEPWLTRRSLGFAHIYLLAQTVIVAAISLLTPGVDYFATLIMALVVQAVFIFPLHIGFRWLVALSVVMAILMFYGHPFGEALPVVTMVCVVNVFIGGLAGVARNAEVAREEAEAARADSHRLLSELQAAHEQLQEYAVQAEALAITSERNRLARDLHDYGDTIAIQPDAFYPGGA